MKRGFSRNQKSFGRQSLVGERTYIGACSPRVGHIGIERGGFSWLLGFEGDLSLRLADRQPLQKGLVQYHKVNREHQNIEMFIL